MKKRVSRCGGEDVGCDVSALSSHCNTEMLRVVLSAVAGQYGKLCLVPDGTVKTSWSKAEALADVLQEQVAFDFPVDGHL